MAKKYIPGVSGLLTEPNPVDSPANTLSEAENVIVDQRGKVQSRHGFNLEDPIDSSRPSAFTELPSIPNLTQKSKILGTRKITPTRIQQDSVFRIMYMKYSNYGKARYYDNVIETNIVHPDQRLLPIDITIPGRIPLYTLDELINICNQQVIELGLELGKDIIFKQIDGYIIIESIHYIEVYYKSDYVRIDSVNYPSLVAVFGFNISQYAHSEHTFDHQLLRIYPISTSDAHYYTGNFVSTTNYSNNEKSFTQLFNFSKDESTSVTGFLVNQKHNLFFRNFDRYSGIDGVFYRYTTTKNDTATDRFRYYLIDETSSKLLAKNELPYSNVTNAFSNDLTMYLQTEDGLAETSLQNMFQPASQRFFTIRWPSFPDLQFTFRKSELYQNWFLSGHKCGFRYTFYRELGYTQEENSIYESEPSKIYEIFNDGQDSVIDIQFVFNTIAQSTEIYKTFNEFTKLNNGRKFGIKLYRTKLIPILTNAGEYNPLSAEYFQCYDFISFDTIFTTKIKHEKSNDADDYDDYSFDEYGILSRYQLNDTRGEFNIGDIISYIPNNIENNLALENDGPTLQSTLPLYNGYIFSKDKVQYRTVDTDINDISLAKLKIVNKLIAKRTERDISEVDNYFTTTDTIVYASTSNGTSTITLRQPYADMDIRQYQYITGPNIQNDTYISYITDNYDSLGKKLELSLSKSTTASSSNEAYTIKSITGKNYNGILPDIPLLKLDPGKKNSNYVGLSAYNAELFDKYINTIEFFTETDTVLVDESDPFSFERTFRLTVDIWEYDFPQYEVYDLINQPIILKNKLATVTTRPEEVNNEIDYKNSINCMLGEVGDNSAKRVNNRIKVTLDNTFEWKSKKSVLVVISFTELYFVNTSIKLWTAPQYNLKNVPYRYDLVRNIIAHWSEGDPPKAYLSPYIDTRFHAVCLSRCDDVYHYNLEAETFITDEMPYSTTMQPGDKLKSDIYAETNVEIQKANNWIETDKTHRFIENTPVKISGATDIGIFNNEIYYVSVKDDLYLARVEPDSDILSLDIIPPWIKLNSSFTISGVTNGTSGVTPNLQGGTVYYVVNLNIQTLEMKISTSLDGDPITVNFYGSFKFTQIKDEAYGSVPPGFFRIKTNTDELSAQNIVFFTGDVESANLQVVQNNVLTRYRAFIKDIKVPIEFNDDSLYNDTVLYTNPNSAGTNYTNYLAPKSVFSVPFKDYQIYAGIKKPLTATMAVVNQPDVEQLTLGVWYNSYMTTTNTNGIAMYLHENNAMTILKSNKIFQLDSVNRKLYIDSSIYKDRLVEVSELTYSGYTYQNNYTYDSPTYTIDENVGEVKTRGSSEFNVPIVIHFTGGRIFTDFKKYKFGATLFERPYLTLKLTSTNNDVEYVSVQLTPFYNRNGYYPLTDKSGEYDKRYLEANNSLDVLNNAQPNTESNSLTIVQRAGLLPGMIEGTEDGQLEADAQYIGSTNIDITNSASAVYYNSNTLTINNISRFTKDKFEEPGLMLVQFKTDDDQAYAILSYSNITTETNATNKHVFKNITINYLSKSGIVVTAPQNLNGITGKVINFWYLKGTTAENLPVYAYKENLLNGVYIEHSDATIREYYNDPLNTLYISYTRPSTKFPSIPPLVFKPHRNYESPVVGYLNKNGNITFTGPAALDQSSYLDQYAWSIIESFNRELQNKGIKAYLTKPNSTGYFEIVYPDGKQIEMLNGKYDPDTGEITYYGNHEFLPALNKDSFTKVAIQNNKAQFAKNEIKWSRNGIPEIVPLANSFVLGKDTKEFIGAAQSVDDLYLFKEDGIFRLRDSGIIDDDIPVLTGSSYQFSTTSICVSGGSIQEINNEIIYLDQNGFMSIVDGGINNISGAIQRDILTLIQTTPKNRIRSFKNESKGLYYCTLINEVDETLGVKSGTYVFSTKTRQWTFMDEEILDGMECNKQENLIVFKQKETNATTSGYTSKNETITIGSKKLITEFNNYYIIRENFTNNLMYNSVDQYDWRYETDAVGTLLSQTYFSIKVFANDLYHKDELLKNMYSTTLSHLYGTDTSGNIVNLLANRTVTFIFTDFYGNILNLTGKLTNVNITNQTTSYSTRITDYVFTFDTPAPSGFVYYKVQIYIGVPAKVTFNPESGTNPDTNKLFQEYMIHTETANKGATMAFKTDSRSNFSNDRRFVYDANATNRNVFRTYIPTTMSRGRYLIRQVKHDLPLENLIITGQTIVMRDSRSTRVQKDGDNE